MKHTKVEYDREGSRSSSSGSRSFGTSSSSDHSRHPEWINKCREILISTETTNIASRVCHWRRIVNEKTDLTNERLNIFIPQNLIPKFEWRVNNLSKYIQFVIQWNGLKMKQIKNSPTNYEEYERKARNWLNGRRAPNYAGTLFPDMIKASEQYADTVSKHLFGPNNQYSKAYHKILMFGFLHSLCSVRISMNDVSKKTFLLCENSIKTNSVTSVLLQQYATDHPFAQYFPSHLKQAADYFQNKFEMDIKRFGNALRLAAGNNMNVNQLNPSITTIPIHNQLHINNINNSNNNLNSINMNGITGLNINDLSNFSLHNLNNNTFRMQQLNGLYSINGINGLNGFNSMNTMNTMNTMSISNINPIQTIGNDPNHKYHMDTKKHIIIKNDGALSPLSVTNSHGSCPTTNTNSTNSILTNNNNLPQIPNLTIPPQIPKSNNSTTNNINNTINNTYLNVNGKQQSVVSFLNQIVSTCNTQQIFMQKLQNRVHSMEQIIKQIKPQIDNNDSNINGNTLKPLPCVQENNHTNNNNNNKNVQFIINPQQIQQQPQPQIQFQQIQTQQIQPIHVQQIQPQSIQQQQQQFVLNSGAATLPNLVANMPNISSDKTDTNINFSNTINKNNKNQNLMDDDLNNAAALLASLRHKIKPKLESNNKNLSIKRQRDINNINNINRINNINNNNNNNNSKSTTPPMKKRKIEGTNDVQNNILLKSNESQS